MLKRILSFALAAIVLLSVLVGCKRDEVENVGDVTVSAATVDEDGNRYDANGYILSDLPTDELDYGGEVINVFTVKSQTYAMFIDEYSENLTFIQESIYNSNLKVEGMLGVEFNPIYTTYDESDRYEKIVVPVRNAHMAGTCDYDLVSFAMRQNGMIVCEGYFTDLLSIENSYIDFEKPWWPKSLTDVSLINNSLFFVGGDISTSYTYTLWGMFYNMNMFDQYHFDDPTKIVNDGKWTLEQFQKMSKEIYTDLDNIEGKSEGDMFGYAAVAYDLDAFYLGTGMKLIEQNNDGDVFMSEDLLSSKAESLVSGMAEFLQTQNAWCGKMNYTDQNRPDRPMFEENRALFHTDILEYGGIITQNATTEFKFGVLPYPKYDEDQDEYISSSRPGVNRTWGIPTGHSDERNLMLTAVLECMGSENYRTVTPAIFEICMKVRYSENEVVSSMYDVIRKNVVYDLGQVITYSVGTIVHQIPSAAMYGGTNFNRQMAFSIPQYNKKLEDVNKVIREIQGK